jgi:RimJ/RimL family protein N-acetyltransferase
MYRVETERLILRRWREEDLAPFAAINADPNVMRFFLSTRTRAESDESVALYERHFETDGYGFAAAERKADGLFVGVIGIQAVRDRGYPFEPAVEVGWRLGSDHWRHGYATEGARAAIAAGFARFGLDEIVACTYAGNWPSRGVMTKLGMSRDPRDDFDHPLVPADHPLRPSVLYRLKRPAG